MKIIHVITAFGIGGAEKLLLDIINRQIEKHEVHLIYLKPINDLIYEVDRRIVVKQILLSFSTIKDLSIYYHKIKPDIIHTHLGHADILGLWAAKNSNTRMFCTMHNIHFKKTLIDNVIFGIYRHLFLNIAKKCRIISISKSVERHVLYTLKVPKERSFLLYNAISKKEFGIKNPNDKKLNLLFVGRLEKQKSIDTLLRAIHHLKQNNITDLFKVIIVGSGSLKGQLEKLMYNLRIQNLVTFTGKQKEVDRFYQEADIFVLPSIWEGFGIVILEAFRARLAVIASNIEGPAELIENNKNGVLFQPQNEIELAKKIQLLIEDNALRNTLAENGYSSFTNKFHIDQYVESLEKLYLNE